jgi:hypothetical protein
MQNKKFTILCSGVALGVYIPGISLAYQLRKSGYAVEVIVLENLILEDVQKKIHETKKAFHNNFKLAQMGQKIARDIAPSLDPEKVEQLFNDWKNEKENHFIVFSGFWLSILDKYSLYIQSDLLNVDIIHMDSVPSPSWQSFKGIKKSNRTFFLFEFEAKRLHYQLKVSSRQPVPFDERDNRLLIHGGGWGMGTYKSKMTELHKRGLSLDVMAYYRDEAITDNKNNRYFMVDTNWSPWVKDKNDEHTFPPVAEIYEKEEPRFEYRDEYHELYYIGAHDKAIISKPGGSTLVDSFSSATPLIFLESFGPHEDFNAALWCDLGFGIMYSDWEKIGFSEKKLYECHDNLLISRSIVPDFLDNYLYPNKNI